MLKFRFENLSHLPQGNHVLEMEKNENSDLWVLFVYKKHFIYQLGCFIYKTTYFDVHVSYSASKQCISLPQGTHTTKNGIKSKLKSQVILFDLLSYNKLGLPVLHD